MRRAAPIVALAIICLAASPLLAAQPRPAPPVYATANHGLTFRTLPGMTYCPLPTGWVGSDHGTILFLDRPRRCGGAGYPSGSRDFEPEVARIEVYYGYAFEEASRRPRCAGARLRFFGAWRRLCTERQGGMIRASLHATYGSGREADLALVTRQARLATDLRIFRRLAATVRSCSGEGPGTRCPRVPWF